MEPIWVLFAQYFLFPADISVKFSNIYPEFQGYKPTLIQSFEQDEICSDSCHINYKVESLKSLYARKNNCLILQDKLDLSWKWLIPILSKRCLDPAMFPFSAKRPKV